MGSTVQQTIVNSLLSQKIALNYWVLQSWYFFNMIGKIITSGRNSQCGVFFSTSAHKIDLMKFFAISKVVKEFFLCKKTDQKLRSLRKHAFAYLKMWSK